MLLIKKVFTCLLCQRNILRSKKVDKSVILKKHIYYKKSLHTFQHLIKIFRKQSRIREFVCKIIIISLLSYFQCRPTETRRAPIHFGSHAPCPIHLFFWHDVHSLNKSSTQSSFPRVSHKISQKSFMKKKEQLFLCSSFLFSALSSISFIPSDFSQPL